jgi:isocitrate dehydrogenase (NAD+)
MKKSLTPPVMHLVLNPQQFDVIVCTNVFGDLLSDLTAGLVGGLGLMPGANIGAAAALFEAVHGSVPDLSGKNLAHPAAVIMAGVIMLNHLGEFDAAKRIKQAIEEVVKEGKQVIPDLNPHAKIGTVEMGNAIVDAMEFTHELTIKQVLVR